MKLSLGLFCLLTVVPFGFSLETQVLKILREGSVCTVLDSGVAQLHRKLSSDKDLVVERRVYIGSFFEWF